LENSNIVSLDQEQEVILIVFLIWQEDIGVDLLNGFEKDLFLKDPECRKNVL